MRKLVVTILTSLDGYVAGPGGDFMVMPLDESFSAEPGLMDMVNR